MTARLYKRQARLMIYTVAVETDGNVGLRMRFNVTRSVDTKANTGRVEVFNLAPTTRARLEGRQRRLSLEAGHEGRTGSILTADTAYVTHQRQGAEWVTTIEALDGGTELRYRISGSFAAGTTAYDVVEAIRTKAGQSTGFALATRYSSSAASALRSFIYQKGLSLSPDHTAESALKQVCGDAGQRVSIQDGALTILGRTEATAGGAVLLRADTGLVGSPERVIDRQKGALRVYLRGEALMMATLAPNRQVRLEAEEEKADLLLTRVDHVGDTHAAGASWLTRWEGRIL